MKKIIVFLSLMVALAPQARAEKAKIKEGKEVKTLTQLADKSGGTLEDARKAGAETFDQAPIRSEGYLEILKEEIVDSRSYHTPRHLNCHRSGLFSGYPYSFYSHDYFDRMRGLDNCDLEPARTETVTKIRQQVRVPQIHKDDYIDQKVNKGQFWGALLGAILGLPALLLGPHGLVLVAVAAIVGAYIGDRRMLKKAVSETKPEGFERTITETHISRDSF